MNPTTPQAKRFLRRGQTLIMAMILLGVLMVLGAVFIALVGHNIRGESNNAHRSLAFDLAEAGVRYAHTELLDSPEGADWRPQPSDGTLRQDDPDYRYLRLPDPTNPNDYGGPDGLGPYTRVSFDRGRALVRVRYAPSDPTIFSLGGVGDLLQPGKARDYTIIESIGRAQSINPNDPTQVSLANGAPRDVIESKKVIAFVPCGLIEHARFITNLNQVTAPADIGFTSDPGVSYWDPNSPAAPVNVPYLLGSVSPALPNPYDPTASGGPLGTTNNVPFGGDLFSNADLMVYGTVIANLNPMLGDGILVAGSIHGADDAATLRLDTARPNGATWQVVPPINMTNNTVPSLNSDNPNYGTANGIVRDDYSSGDLNGYPRGIPREDPPLISKVDPVTDTNRYVQLTKFAGSVEGPNAAPHSNAGAYGAGPGVFVNNASDIQIPADEQGRLAVGSAESLPYDWLNPDNGQANTGWQGPFYVPYGAYLRFYSDGFLIVRDGQGPAEEQRWMEPDGTLGKYPGKAEDSNNPADVSYQNYCRYKLVRSPSSGQIMIFNSFSVHYSNPIHPVIDINDVNVGNVDTKYADAGYPFNGILYFEGNVRVRGEIPTDIQLTVVSGGTIYVEGSITKGVINSGTRPNLALGRRITTPSKSMLALLAKDYVCLNTTQFFGTDPQQHLEEVHDSSGPTEWNPVRVRTPSGGINLITEFDLDPTSGNPNDPSTWTPYVTNYLPSGATSGFENTNLLLAHTMDDGPAPFSFVNMEVNYPDGNPNVPDWQYLFPLDADNAASSFYPLGYTPPNYSVSNVAPVYGLGSQPWQRYKKYESDAFPLVTSDFTFNPLQMLVSGANTSPSGLYHLLVGDSNEFALKLQDAVGGQSTNDYILARAAVVPHDIRIEAVMYAEQGSFFVIPGPWFNPDPNDTRANYINNLGATQAERDQARLEDFGSTPNTPFYGEPLDVKISILGSVSENMPPPMSQQAEWLKKWGWIPRYHGASGELIPQQHTSGFDVNPSGANYPYVPNITISYDPVLATDRNGGFVGAAGPAIDVDTMVRYKSILVGGNPVFYALPPLPGLPVSPTLAYFGEVNP